MPQPKVVDMAAQAIHQAKELEYEKALLLERVGANRELCRMLDKNDLLDEDQGAWLDSFYPVKNRGETRDRAEVERTRQVKKEAREEIAAERGESAPTEADES